MPHEVPTIFSTLIHRCQSFKQEDMVQATDKASNNPLGQTWFRPDKPVATTPFRRTLKQIYGNLARVDLSLPEGLLVGLGYAATNPDSPFSFHQAQSAAERSGVAGLHQWSIMLPTSARVSQEVFEPLIGIQYPMLCSFFFARVWTPCVRCAQVIILKVETLQAVKGRRKDQTTHPTPPKQNKQRNPPSKNFQSFDLHIGVKPSETWIGCNELRAPRILEIICSACLLSGS